MTVSVRIGVDMGGNDIKFGATNLDADQILLDELVKRPSLTAEGPQKTAAQMIDGISAVMEQLGKTWSDLADISMTVPCPCTPDGVIIQAPNLGTAETKDLWKVPFGELLSAAIKETHDVDIPVFACNDANAAGQDDDFARFGLDATPRSSVFITTGTGVGGCVIINGSVFFGCGQAGELGHVKPAVPAQYAERFGADTNPPCGCTGNQCVETRASLTGLKRRIQWALSDDGVALISKQLNQNGEAVNNDVVDQLRTFLAESAQVAAYNVRTFADRDQDPFCRWLLEDWGIMIGVLFANIAPILHPNLLVIGGGMTELSASAKDWFINIVRRAYSEVNGQPCFDSNTNDCEIAWSVSQDQGWRGAILMGIRAHQS